MTRTFRSTYGLKCELSPLWGRIRCTIRHGGTVDSRVVDTFAEARRFMRMFGGE